MSTATTTKPMTADEFFDWVQLPENDSRWFELVRGEVIELPRPTKRHGVICLNVGRLLWNYASQRGIGYVAVNDTGVILERDPDTVRGPDVALYEDAQTFEELHPKWGEVAPRLAVEVLSPNDRWSRVTQKITDYLKNGVALVWLVDPQNRDVTVYQPGKEPYTVDAQQALTGCDVLPELSIRVGDLFLLPGEAANPPA